ncbi:MAG: hypothetical protein HY557_04240 [Euryarchaeota archaeon]|nr:hypothetical protein [Euryarchaeota archaeon]
MVRATVVGSYPRVDDSFDGQRLRRAIARREKGEISREELRTAEVSVVQEVVREQSELGVDVATDGQVTWHDALSHFAAKLDGFEITGLVRYFDTNTYYRQPRRIGSVRWRGAITVDDWKAAAAASPVPVKAVVTGPYTLAELSANGSGRDAVRELAVALGQEVRALVAAGARHVQIDEPALVHSKALPRGYAEAADLLLAGKGSAETSLFTYFGGVAPILRDLLELPFDVLGLDLVQGSDTLAALRTVDANRGVAFGLVDARNTKLEDSRRVAEQVLGFEDRVPLERSYVAPSNGLEYLPRGKAREKVRVLVAAAKAVREAL